MSDFTGPERISNAHAVDDFDCGEPEFNEYLQRFALASDRSDGARTYVVHKKGTVVGFYSLVLGAVALKDAPARVKRGLGAYPIGVIVLARLAVRQSEQGQRLGEGLLKDAMIRCARVAEEAGARALVAHAKHEHAKTFYERFGFEPSPTDELHLFLLMKDLRGWLRDAGYEIP